MVEERYTQPWLEKLEAEIVAELARSHIPVMRSKYITNLFPTDAWWARQMRLARMFPLRGSPVRDRGERSLNPDDAPNPYEKLTRTFNRGEGVAVFSRRDGIGAIGHTPARVDETLDGHCPPGCRSASKLDPPSARHSAKPSGATLRCAPPALALRPHNLEGGQLFDADWSAPLRVDM